MHLAIVLFTVHLEKGHMHLLDWGVISMHAPGTEALHQPHLTDMIILLSRAIQSELIH